MIDSGIDSTIRIVFPLCMLDLFSANPHGLRVCVLLLAVVVAACGGSEQALTKGELEKLDPALRRLVQGSTPQGAIPSTTRPDGTVAYAAFIRATDAERVREAGLPINSVSGNILTAWLSTSELRKAARLEVVTSIESSGEASPQAN
jgi:hypothetical protein